MAADPFLRPRLVVKKRNLPFRILETHREQSLRQVNRILRQAIQVTSEEVNAATEVETDEVTAGTAKVDPEESLRQDKFEPANPLLAKQARIRKLARQLRVIPLVGRVRSTNPQFTIESFKAISRFAERLSKEDFMALVEGRDTHEEEMSMALDDIRQKDKVRVWADAYQKFRGEGLSAQLSKEKADQDISFLRMDSLASGGRSRLIMVRDKWDEERRSFGVLKDEAAVVLKESGGFATSSYEAVWNHVQKAKKKKRKKGPYG